MVQPKAVGPALCREKQARSTKTATSLPDVGQKLIVEVIAVRVGDVEHAGLAVEALPVKVVVERVRRPRAEEAGVVTMPRIANDLSDATKARFRQRR